MSADPASLAPPTLAPLVPWLVARLPLWPPSMAAAAILSLALGRLIDPEPLRALRGKLVELHVTDAALRVRLIYTGSAFVPAWGTRAADLRVSASAHDFFRLARRQVDPDSLFFDRRLLMEGDTELGVLLKNTLDAVDFTALLPRR